MKSITVTTLRSINFGAVLQAYALHKVQCSLGIENLLLDTPKKDNLYEKLPKRLSRRSAIVLAQNISYYLSKRSTKMMLDRFDAFISSNIKRTQVFESYDALCQKPPEADFFINGSDQVFGLRDKNDKILMMDFLPMGIKKFSYAASLGDYEWNIDEKELFKHKLQGFSKISVREKYAKDYLESFTDTKCQVNIDPVFLLSKNEWNKVASPAKQDTPYILCYPILGNVETQNVVDVLKMKTGYKVICVQTLPIKRIKADEYIFDAGPAEFISLISGAEAVVTTSFHGTAFSIIYEKPFYTLIKEYKSQRITDLLQFLDLTDRIYAGQELTLDIDFSKARDVISVEQKRSFSYFNEIIEICRTDGERI